MAADQFKRDLRKLDRQLQAYLSPGKIHAHAIRLKYTDEVLNVVIDAAKDGVGPGGEPYAPWSKSYVKQLGVRAAGKLFLVGLDKPNMLDRKRFNWVLHASTGRLWLRWKGPVYGAVHQGKEFGGTGYAGNSKYPERPWLHFLSPAANQAVKTMYRLVFEARTAKFNAGNLR